MPQVIPFIAYAAATYAGASAVATAAIVLVTSIAVAEYEKIQAEAEARQNYLNSLQDRLIQLRSGIATRSYVIGTVRTGGALLYLKPLGFKGEALDQVVAFANNECEIVNWLIGDDIVPASVFPGGKYGRQSLIPVADIVSAVGPNATISTSAAVESQPHVTWRKAGVTGTATGTTVGAPSGNSVVVSGLPSGTSEVTISYQTFQAAFLRGQFHAGSNSQTPTDWVGYTNPDWNSAHRLAGVCHARTLMIWDQNVWQSGSPPVTAVLKGLQTDGYPFYDPRDGSNPVGCTNPAIVAAWWMTLPRFMGGMGIPTDWVDWTSVAAAANICDELVTVRNIANTGYEQIKRYSCDTQLDTANSPIDNLNNILSSMAGTRAFTSGKYKIFAGAFRPSAITLSDGHIIGTKPISVNTANIEDDPPNIVTATISDINQQFQQSNPTPVTNTSYISSDGYENPLDITLGATTDPRRARYLMGIALERGRPAFGISLSVGGIGETLGLYDTVQLSLSNRPQYAGRTFEIVSMVDNWDGTFDLTLSELKTTTFALDPNTYTPTTPVTPVDNSYLWNPPDPTGFEIGSITPTTLPDGTAVARVVLTWDPIAQADPSSRFELRYRTTGGNFIDAGSLQGDSTGTVITAALIDGEMYQWELRFVNGLGAVSNWVDAYTGVTGTPLPTPQSMRISASSLIFRVPQTGNALPASITLQIIRTGGLSASVAWTTSPSVTLGGSGDTRTLTFANDTADSVQITATIVQSGVTYVDTVTISKVYDGANATADLTAPPTPTGLGATSFISNLLIAWDQPTFTVGHGYAQTVIYAAQVITGQSAPIFTTAKVVGSSPGTTFVMPVDPGTSWAIWIKYQTRDGVLSSSPAGGTNGLQATATLLGTANLADDLITAAKLAAGSVGASELAPGAVDATKIASGLETIKIVTGALPSTKVASVIYHTDDAKLYHWNGSTYTAATAAADISGQLTDAQLASIAAAKLTGTLTSTQIGPNTIQTGNLQAGAVTSAQIAADTITAANIAANAIGASELAAGSVVAGKIAVNAVTAGTIAAAAVTATQIAAGAITTEKLLVAGQGAALNPDPSCSDITAWQVDLWAASWPIIANISDGIAGPTVLRSQTPYSYFSGRHFPFDASKTYRVRGQVRNAGGNGVFYLGFFTFDQNGTYTGGFWPGAAAVNVGSSFTEFKGNFGSGTSTPFPSGARVMSAAVALNYGGTTGYMEIQDFRIEEVIPGSLIVDGAITATKLAANSIVVGTAAIQNGAIVNAMIGNAAIQTANILDASVNTIKIAGQAVTVPIGVSLGSPVSYPASGQQIGSWLTVLSTVIANSGAPAALFCSAQCNTGINPPAFFIRLLRDGSVLWSGSGGSQGQSGVNPVPSNSFLFVLDNPGAGSHTYDIQVLQQQTLTCSAAQLLSIETKR